MHLCNAKLRKIVNLLDYETEITKCVLKVLPDALVEVRSSFFVVMTEFEQTNGEARKIGKLMGQTLLGTYYTKEHFYRNSSDNTPARSGKIFIEVRNPKTKITIDDETAEREIETALAEMSEDKPVHEQCNYSDIPIAQLEHEAPPPCQCA